MKKRELMEKLDLTETQYGLLVSTSIRGLQLLAGHLVDTEEGKQEDKLTYTREDIDVLVKLFDYDFEWDWEID